MHQVIIPIGIAYAQLLEDVRAVVRHELQHAPPPSTDSTPTPTEELLSIREAAVMLGVTIPTVHEWKRRGLLKYYQLGSRTYLKRADVLEALQGSQRTGEDSKPTNHG